MEFINAVVKLMDEIGIDAETACGEIYDRDDNYLYDKDNYE